jgi:hypothetical protein
VVDQHIKELKKYDNNEYEKENAKNVMYYLMLIKESELYSHKKIERRNGFLINYPN